MIFLSPSPIRCTSIYAKHMPNQQKGLFRVGNILKYIDIVLKQLAQGWWIERENHTKRGCKQPSWL